MKQMTEIKVKENPSRKSITVDKDSDPEYVKNKRLETIQKNLKQRDNSMEDADEGPGTERNANPQKISQGGGRNSDSDERSQKRGKDSRKDKYRV